MKTTLRDIATEICSKYNVTLSKEGKNTLVSILHPLYLIRGKNAVTAGEVCESLYYTKEGMLFELYERDGKEITRRIMHEGDLVASLESFITGAPAFQTITVFEPATLYEIRREDLARVSLESPELCQLYIAFYERMLIDLDQWYYDMMFGSAQQRYERLIQHDPEIALRAPMKRIASLLQMKPETLSRVRSIVHGDEEL